MTDTAEKVKHTTVADAELKAAVDHALARGALKLDVQRAIRTHVPEGKIYGCPPNRRSALLADLHQLGCNPDTLPLLRKLAEVGAGHGGQFSIIGLHNEKPPILTWVPNEGGVDAITAAMGAAVRSITDQDGYGAHVAPVLYKRDITEGSRGKEADIIGQLAVVVDDVAPTGLPFDPYAAVETSPANFQVWAFFDQPYPVADVKPVLDALVHAVGADTTQSPTHTYRLPGTKNYPTQKKIAAGRSPVPFRAALLLGDDAALDCYDAMSLAALRSAIVAKYPAAFTAKQTVAEDFDWDEAATSSRKAFTEEELWTRLNDPKFHDDRSAGLASFYAVARLRGHSPEETVNLVLKHVDTVCGSKVSEQSDPEQWLRDDVQRWWQKQAPLPKIEDSFAKPEPYKADHDVVLTGMPRHLILPDTKDELRKLTLPDYSRGRAENTVRNATICVQALNIDCSYDMFHGKKMVGGTAFGSSVHMVSDLVAHLIRRVCMEVWPVEFTQPKMYDAITQACLVNQFNPVVDYLDGLHWDGTPRIETWLIDLFGVADTPYARAVSKIILIAAVRRARRPGTKFDQCVVLEGPEGKNKSTAIRHMAEAAGPGNFSDAHILTLDQKQQMELLKGVWLYEIADLTGLRKAEVEKVKAFMSKQEDRARAAYDRETSDQKRQCVFFASTNDGDYLQSMTGNRRWWPLKTTKACDLDKLDAIRDQLWAEAAQLEANGASIVLPEELWPFAAEEQEGRRTRDPWEDALAHVTGEKCPLPGRDDAHEERVHSTELFGRYLRLDAIHQTSATGKRLKQIMLRLGWEYKANIRIGHRNNGGYVRTVEGPLPEPRSETTADTLPDDPEF